MRSSSSQPGRSRRRSGGSRRTAGRAPPYPTPWRRSRWSRRNSRPPAVARRRVLLARNGTPEDALADGVLDELAASEAVIRRALDVARELAALPRLAYARIKRQLRA